MIGKKSYRNFNKDMNTIPAPYLCRNKVTRILCNTFGDYQRAQYIALDEKRKYLQANLDELRMKKTMQCNNEGRAYREDKEKDCAIENAKLELMKLGNEIKRVRMLCRELGVDI